MVNLVVTNFSPGLCDSAYGPYYTELILFQAPEESVDYSYSWMMARFVRSMGGGEIVLLTHNVLKSMQNIGEGWRCSCDS